MLRLKSTLDANGSHTDGVDRPNEYALSQPELFFPCQPGRSSESHPSRRCRCARKPDYIYSQSKHNTRMHLLIFLFHPVDAIVTRYVTSEISTFWKNNRAVVNAINALQLACARDIKSIPLNKREIYHERANNVGY